MAAPLLIAAAAMSTWASSAALNYMNLRDDNLSTAAWTFESKNGEKTEIPAAAVAAGVGVLTFLLAPVGLIGAVGAGIAAGGLSAWTTSAQVVGAGDAARRQISTGGDAPDWLVQLANL